MFSTIKKLKDSLSKTRDTIFGKIGNLLKGRKLDDDLIDEIEEILLKADVGVSATEKILDNLRDKASENKITDSDGVIKILKEEISKILSSNRREISLDNNQKPSVWLIAGVNGTGKTTTVGKLAHYFKSQNKKVMIAACDTFRAAAVEQVGIWAERSGVEFVKAQKGADPASIAYDASVAAKSRGIDILLIDTAGRLHTKTNLMKELEKIRRVTEKVIPSEQIFSRLVIDGTTGQNAISQVKIFVDAIGCDSLIISKLDGTAKGGVMIAIAEELSVPVDFIGIGESIEDLEPFDANNYAEALFDA
ncbi:MAG: signal recognition particle-docking protein FtsY [candidate division Zixibacteria bacterium]|nr:signal recognition particle-docking protein FtsY [candidate division Zixibacteria bacterium]